MDEQRKQAKSLIRRLTLDAEEAIEASEKEIEDALGALKAASEGRLKAIGEAARGGQAEQRRREVAERRADDSRLMSKRPSHRPCSQMVRRPEGAA